MPIGIKGIAYAFDRQRDIATLPRLAEDADLLSGYERGGHRSFGHSDGSLSEQAIASARQTLADTSLPAQALDAVVVGCASIRFWPRYAELLSTEILLGIGVKDVPVFGVTMGGCANYSNALRIAKALLRENTGWRNVLLIETNKLPNDDMRHYMPYVSVFGDGSVSAIVSHDNSEFEIAGIAHVAKPLDAENGGDPRFVTNNINGYRRVIAEALRQADCEVEQVDMVIPNNKNVAELEKLASFWNVPFSKVFVSNVGRIGHLWSADNLINLKDACAEPRHAGHQTFLLLCQGDSTYGAVVLRRCGAES